MTAKFSIRVIAMAALCLASIPAMAQSPVAAGAAAPAMDVASTTAISPAASSPAATSATTPSFDATGLAATVNDYQISMHDVVTRAMRDDGPSALARLIDEYLITQEAAKDHVTVTDAELQSEIDGLAKAIAPRSLDDALKEHHQTVDDLKHDFQIDLLQEKLVAFSAPVGKLVHIRDLAIQVIPPGTPPSAAGKMHTEADALAIIHNIQAQLKAGKDFVSLIRQYSEDKSKVDGDDGITFDGCEGVDPNLTKVALTLNNVGDISPDPARTAFGYHLIQVISTDTSHPASENDAYAAAADQSKSDWAHQNMGQYMDNLRKQANIQRFVFAD